jgi:hypothetical protein
VASFRGLQFAFFGWRKRLGDERVEQAAAGVGGGSEACLKLVAQRNEFIDLGDDAGIQFRRSTAKICQSSASPAKRRYRA